MSHCKGLTDHEEVIGVFHSFDPEGFELSTRFYWGLTEWHRAIRHGTLEGISKLNIAHCKWKKRQKHYWGKSDEWKNKVAESLCDLF